VVSSGIPIPQTDFFSMWQALRNGMPGMPGGMSDQLGGDWLQAMSGFNANTLNNLSQMTMQNQTNQLRQAELMGTQGGAPTDAANRWRAELQAQQAVQNQRLQQEYAQLLGFDPRNNNVPTLAAIQEANRVGESQADRASREAMQRAQFGQESYLNAAQFQQELARLGITQGFQGQETAAERNLRAALQNQQLGVQITESAAERQMRQALQSQQLAVGSQESALERQLRTQLQGGQLGQQEAEFARNYLLQQEASRRQQSELSGVLAGGGLTEQARAARAAEAARVAELSGQIEGGGLTEQARAAREAEALRRAELMGTGTGGALTEESRAAREQERTQRAALAAQLLQAPKDVFRAGAYFKSLRGGDPTGIGLGGNGGGIMGFNSILDRAGGTPGTVSMDDIEAASAQIQAPGAGSMYGTPGLPNVPANPSGANSPTAPGVPAGGTTTPSPRAAIEAGPGASAAAALAAPSPTPPDEEEPGSTPSFGAEPGGPVGATGGTADLVAAGLGDLGLSGMGGGRFPGRAAPSPVAATPVAQNAPIPFVDPSVLEDPSVQKMFQDMRRIGERDQRDARRARRSGKTARPSGPGGSVVSVGPYRFNPKAARERAVADERYLRGLSRLERRGVLPGSQPGGPVDAPLWPTGDTGTSMPELQAPGSLGDSSFAAPPATASAAPAAGIPSVMPSQQDQTMAAFNQILLGGIGNLGPQALERMSKTERGIAEGATQAAGLSWDDLEDAYAQSRYANTGNALLA